MSNEWNSFQSRNGGKGWTRERMREEYHDWKASKSEPAPRREPVRVESKPQMSYPKEYYPSYPRSEPVREVIYVDKSSEELNSIRRELAALKISTKQAEETQKIEKELASQRKLLEEKEKKLEEMKRKDEDEKRKKEIEELQRFKKEREEEEKRKVQFEKLATELTSFEIDPSKLKKSTKSLGRGTFGEVFRGEYHGVQVAVKELVGSKDVIDIHSFIKEITRLHSLKHPNIIQFLGACTTGTFPSLIMELMDTSLTSFLKNDTSDLDHSTFFKIASDVALGLRYLHEQKEPLAHLDLKSMNILLDKSVNAKLCDFGLSKTQGSIMTAGLSAKNIYGTAAYAAPECLTRKRKEQRGIQSDIFSYGVVLWEMLVKKIPWQEEQSIDDISEAVRDGERLPLPANCPKNLALLIQQCWEDNPKLRPTASQVVVALQQLCTPDEWKTLLKSAGASVEEIENPKVTTVLMEAATVAQKMRTNTNNNNQKKFEPPKIEDLLEATQKLKPVDKPKLCQVMELHSLNDSQKNDLRSILEKALLFRRESIQQRSIGSGSSGSNGW